MLEQELCETKNYIPSENVAARIVILLGGAHDPVPYHPRSSFNLTTRQYQLCAFAAEGLPNKQIAKRLGIEVRTVKNHFTKIFKKLSASDRTEAICRIIQDPLTGQPLPQQSTDPTALSKEFCVQE